MEQKMDKSRRKSKSRRSLWLTALILAVLVIAGGAYYYSTIVAQAAAKATAEKTIKTAKVQKGDITISAAGTANLVPVAEVGLAFRSAGQVAMVHVKEGDIVKQGQALATIDDRSLKLIADQQYAVYEGARAAYTQTIKGGSMADIASAQAALFASQAAYTLTSQGATPGEVASARLSLASAQATYNDLLLPPSDSDVANSKAQMLNAEIVLRRAQAAYDRAYAANPAGIGGASEGMELEKAVNDYRAAKSAYDRVFEARSDSTLANAQANIASAQVRVDSLIPTQQSIAAAFSNVAAAQSRLAALTPDPETIEQAKAKVDQAYAAWRLAEQVVTDATIVAPFDGLVKAVNVAPGSSATTSAVVVTLMDISKSWVDIAIDDTDASLVANGYLVDVTFDAWPDQTFLGTIVKSDATVALVNGVSTLYATAELKEPTSFLRIGMSGSAKITAASAKQVLTVPVEAIHEISPGKYTVFVVNDVQQLTLFPVEIGLKGSSLVEIKSGLKAGDIVSTGTVATQ